MAPGGWQRGESEVDVLVIVMGGGRGRKGLKTAKEKERRE